MGWRATQWAREQTTGSPGCKLVLMLLASYADDQGACYPSQGALAAGAEHSVDTVQRAILKLRAENLVSVHRKRTTGGKWTNCLYQLTMPQGYAVRQEDLPHRKAPVATPQGARNHTAQLCGTNLHLESSYNLQQNRKIEIDEGRETTRKRTPEEQARVDAQVEEVRRLLPRNGRKSIW